MKIPGHCGKRPSKSILVLIALAVLLAMIGIGTAWGSSAGNEPHGSATGDVAHGGEQPGGVTEHVEHGGGGHGIQWQNTDWYRVMNFTVLAVALFLLLRKPASQALGGRIKGIKEELADLENRKASVEKQLAEYSQKLAALDQEAEQIISDYIRQGEESKARILKEAELAADKLKEQAQKNIAHEFQRAKLQLQAEIVEKALSKAEKIIQEQITAQDQNRLVDEYLQKVVA
jgi:F-type H+-transporting ATPase subunit b